MDVNGAGIGFTSLAQEERGALALVNGIVYVPYSGYFGDCPTYHGTVVGVHIDNPSMVGGWATAASKGGIWGHSGVASDGTNMFVITGNTTGTGGTWGGGEAIIRLQAGPIFSGQTTDYWAPTNWLSLDNNDTDLGGVQRNAYRCARTRMPSQLVLALGKDGNAYLVNRNNLGGVAAPVAQLNDVDGVIRGQSSATYTTAQGTYFVFRASGEIRTYKITATNPPTITFAWSASQSGQGSPWVTTTDGTNNAIVWVVGAQGDRSVARLQWRYRRGCLCGRRRQRIDDRRPANGIAASLLAGSIYVANDNKVYKFRIPGEGTPTPTAYSNC